jgi:hypothetical protein
MTKDRFIRLMIGKPWVNRACSFKEVDCYGLVLLYYKSVLKQDINTPFGYTEQIEMHELEGDWEVENCEDFEEASRPVENAIIGFYSGEKLAHVGVMVSPTKVLQCRGSVDKPGAVEMHSVRSISKLFSSTRVMVRVQHD